MSNRDKERLSHLCALLNKLCADQDPYWAFYGARSSAEAKHFVKIRAAFAASKVK